MTRRLILSYLALALLVLVGLEIPLGYLYARGEESRFSRSVERDASMLAEVAEENIEKGNLTALPELASEYAEANTGARVVIVDRTGHVLTDSTGTTAPGTTLADEPDIAAALRNQPTVATRTGTDGIDVLATTMPGASGTTIRGALRVTYPITAVTVREHRIWTALAVAGASILAAVALVAFTLARWITRPLRALERATTQLAAGRLDDPPDSGNGPPELRRLAASFTHTATRLQHLLQAQHGFASEASHQLKTPLTSLRLRLENLEPHLDPRAQPNLEETIGEVERLSRMVHGLLALARLENTATTPETVDADAVLAEREAMWEPLAAEQHVTITVSGAPAGQVWAIPGALEQIIDNLVANALRVSPPGTTITLVRAPGVDLHVIDQGPGMPAADRERAFDRFWRASDSPHDGSGLGLPIVRHLVHASGGEITLQAAPGGGLDAHVRLRPAGRERRIPATALPARGPRRSPRHAERT
ncbi:HAMP domain-containing histidine kinase [Streptomyces actinomycinicus]|uniref:histidine kinase n=1 Tax=Streptomyces actinomycinicus TaxID=1695166 RepID=A0A937EGU3_9ACTN|nr:HAMP domain-containing sensor histidine kinase [Streptomyces actinomycinicus]MBL1082253.1 HAMP domain-containing histidine kinase [Streptomyces actinomycinicus]